MDLFGSYALLLAFALAIYAIAGGIAAIITRRPLLIKSARNAGFAVCALIWLGFGSLVYLFFTDNFAMAFAKAELAASTDLPLSGQVAVSVRDEDKRELEPIARGLHEMGFRLIATRGTAQALRQAGLEVVEVQLLGGGGARVLRIFIDKPEGVTHADCEMISQNVGTILDEEDVIPGAHYTLEVSSPGVERKLIGVALGEFSPAAINRNRDKQYA